MSRIVVATSAVVQQNNDITPIDVAPDGTLHAHAPAGATATGDLVDVLAAINVAHEVTSAAGAGSRSGWTADACARIDGTAETTIDTPEGQRRQRARQGGFNGGFGGFGGGRGGSGGGRPGGGPPDGEGADDVASAGDPPRACSPITLDLHVTGHVTRNALAHMSVVATRRIVIGGLTYTNVGTSTIDVVR